MDDLAPVPPARAGALPAGGDAALDEALLRVTGLDVPPPSPFVNHAPMACEALAVLGREERITTWAERSAARLTPGSVPVEPVGGVRFDWEEALGDHRRLPEWLGLFGRAIEDAGWEPVVRTWVPRLVPGLSAALFHGVIRTAHAVRAVETVDTPVRRVELARALGLWASWCRPGADPDPDPDPGEGDTRQEVVGAAADGARCYLADPSIFNLHGVTGAMAVELLVGHVSASDGTDALRQLRAEHASLYGWIDRVRPGDDEAAWDDEVVSAAADSFDPHQVKLVEACRRGFRATGDGSFAAAARLVTGRP